MTHTKKVVDSFAKLGIPLDRLKSLTNNEINFEAPNIDEDVIVLLGDAWTRYKNWGEEGQAFWAWEVVRMQK